MNFQSHVRLRNLVVVAGTTLWGAATLVAAQDTPTVGVKNATLDRPSGGAEVMEFVVTRSGDTSLPITVGYQTQDSTAKAGTDYIASRGVVTVPAGATSAAIEVPILPNSSINVKSLVLNLTGASGPLDLPPAGSNSRLEANLVETGDPFGKAVAADFNGDGRVDLVANPFDPSGDNAPAPALLFVLNTSTTGAAIPSFAPATDLGLGRPLAAADLNGDGKPDLIVKERDRVSVALNITPDPASPISFSTRTELSTILEGLGGPIAVADFNGDGKPDIYLCNTESIPAPPGAPIPPSIVSSVFVNTTKDGETVFSFSKQPESFAGGTHIVAADIDNDGRLDLFLRSHSRTSPTNTLFALRNITKPGAPAVSFAPGGLRDLVDHTFPDFAVADFNRDGRVDLAANGKLSLNTTPPGGDFSFEPSTSLYVQQFTERVFSTVGDFNADGLPDVLFNDQIFLNTSTDQGSSPTFTAPIFSNISGIFESTSKRVFGTADLNGDGKPEVVGGIVQMLPVLRAELSKEQGTGTIRATPDTMPKRFSFIDRQDVGRGRLQISNAITVRGINRSTPVRVSGGSYSINDGAFSTSEQRVRNGDRIRVRLVSAGQYSTEVNAKLTIGGVSDTFTTETKPPPMTLSRQMDATNDTATLSQVAASR